jgi:hypothetical protein
MKDFKTPEAPERTPYLQKINFLKNFFRFLSRFGSSEAIESGAYLDNRTVYGFWTFWGKYFMAQIRHGQ